MKILSCIMEKFFLLCNNNKSHSINPLPKLQFPADQNLTYVKLEKQITQIEGCIVDKLKFFLPLITFYKIETKFCPRPTLSYCNFPCVLAH